MATFTHLLTCQHYLWREPMFFWHALSGIFCKYNPISLQFFFFFPKHKIHTSFPPVVFLVLFWTCYRLGFNLSWTWLTKTVPSILHVVSAQGCVSALIFLCSLVQFRIAISFTVMLGGWLSLCYDHQSWFSLVSNWEAPRKAEIYKC